MIHDFPHPLTAAPDHPLLAPLLPDWRCGGIVDCRNAFSRFG